MSNFREENIRVRIQAISDLPEVGDQLSELIRLTKQQQEITQQAALAARTGAIQQVTAIEGVTQALKEQQTTQKKSSDDQADGLKKVGTGYDELGKQVRNFATLVASAFTLNEIKNFGMDVIDAKTKIDSLKISLDVMLGSKRESAELYQQMVQLAKQTPFSLEEVAENVVKLKAYNIATEELIPTITALGNIAAAVGKEKLPQLTLAYGQVMNFGKLMGTELRQFTEAGVPLFDLLADSMHKTRDEVIKLTQDHQIIATDVKKAIMEASEVGGKYYNMMALQAKTLGGEVSNLSDTFFIAKGRIGDYFEKEIKTGIKAMADLMNATVGSNAAIERSVDIVKSIAAAFATYTVATKAQAIIETTLSALTATKNVLYGEYLLAMRAVTAQQVVFTAAETEAVTAAQAFNLVISKNPIGLLVTVIGTAVAAFYAFKSANVEVTEAMGEQEYAIRKEQADLESLAESALTAAAGTKRRKEYIDLLISKYPEYFSGIDSETVSNAQLKSILDKVNGSYEDRIALAKEAYQVEKLNDQRRKLWDEEADAIGRLTARVPELKQFGNDAVAVMDYLSKNADANFKARNANGLGSWLDQAVNGNPVETLKAVNENLNKVESQLKASDDRIRTSKAASNTAEVDAIKAHYDVLRQQADGNSKEIERLNAAEKTAISKANGTYRSKEEAETVTHVEKLKTITLLSADELSEIKNRSNTATFAQQMKYLEAEEKLEIDHITKIKVSTKTSEDEILALKEAAAQKAADIYEKYRKIREAAEFVQGQLMHDNIQAEIDAFQKRNEGQQEYIDKTTVGFKQLAQVAEQRQKAEVAGEKDVQREREETIKVMEKAADVEEKTRRRIIVLIADFVSQASPLLGSVAKGLLSVIDNVDTLAGKSMQTAQEQVKAAETHLIGIKALYDNGVAGTAKQMEDAKQAVAESQMKLSETKLETAQTVFGVMGSIYQVFTAIAGAFNAAQAEVYKAIADGLQKTRDAYRELNDMVMQSQAEAHKQELANLDTALQAKLASLDNYYQQELAKASAQSRIDVQVNYESATKAAVQQALADKLASIDSYYAKEKEYAIGQDRLDAQMAYYQKIAEVQSKAGATAKDLIEGVAQAEADKTKATYELQIAEAKFRIAKAEEVRDATLAAIDAELNAFKAAKQKEIDAENEALAQKKAAAEVYYSDKALRMQNDDVYRQQLLEQGEAREVAALEAAKAREIQRAIEAGASAEEVARIRIAFDKLITEKHAEYETAQGNKTAETSLANQEIKAQEASKKQDLEAVTATNIQEIMETIAKQEAASAQDRLNANAEFARQNMMAQNSMFNANKAMKIAELQAEIAVLEAQKGLFANNGAINAAISSIQASIGTIAALSFDTGSVSIQPIRSVFGVVNLPKATPVPIGGVTPTTPGGGGGGGGGGSIPIQPVDGLGQPVYAAYDDKGNEITLTYDPGGHSFAARDRRGNAITVRYATGFAAATGQTYYLGTEYVDDPSRPDGIDTVKAMLTKGERVVSVDHNRRLGGISNEELVEKVSYFDRLAAKFPQLLDPAMWSEMASVQLTLPAGVMTQSGGTTLDISGLRSDLKNVESAIKNQKTTAFNIDRNGLVVSMISQQAKTNFYGNLMNR